MTESLTSRDVIFVEIVAITKNVPSFKKMLVLRKNVEPRGLDLTIFQQQNKEL